MPVVNIFYGSCCGAEEVIRQVRERTGYEHLDDAALIAETGRRYGVDESKMRKALSGKASIFNKFTHERERCLAYLKRVMADRIGPEDLVISGLSSLLLPQGISHVLNVCLIAEMKYRVALARRKENISEKEAARRIHKEDEGLVALVEQLLSRKDPWASEFYDMVLPMGKVTEAEAAGMICDQLKSSVLTVSQASMRAVSDFALAAEVNLKLTKEGHDVGVTAENGVVTMEINKNVLILSALEEELKKTAMSVPGVLNAVTKVGPGYYQSDVYRKFDFDLPLPSKVLLVDDEREFVETLSERLQMRDYSSAVVYGGEEALSIVEEDEPEVMILDLKMPGIDGIEVLRRVKEKHPDVEVIVLTGHGSDEIAKLCLEMGACAYLEKPADIEKLTRTMQEAYERVKARKKSAG